MEKWKVGEYKVEIEKKESKNRKMECCKLKNRENIVFETWHLKNKCVKTD